MWGAAKKFGRAVFVIGGIAYVGTGVYALSRQFGTFQEVQGLEVLGSEGGRVVTEPRARGRRGRWAAAAAAAVKPWRQRRRRAQKRQRHQQPLEHLRHTRRWRQKRQHQQHQQRRAGGSWRQWWAAK